MECTARNLNYACAGGGMFKTPVVMVTSVRTEVSSGIDDLYLFVMFDMASLVLSNNSNLKSNVYLILDW